MEERPTEVVIVGGGVAGLWLLRRLHDAGVDALLLEAGDLGQGQSIAAQGIIHGGMKYALTGELTADAEQMFDVPAHWRSCLAGRGELDLSAARELSPHQLLWSPGSLVSRVAAFFASKLVRSRMEALDPADHPAVFREQESFAGSVYRLDEVVLDSRSVLEALVEPVRGRTLAIDWPGGVDLTIDGTRVTALELLLGGERLRLRPGALVLTAGSGNAAWMDRLGLPGLPGMQRRPLHMVMARALPSPLWAHCLGASNRPRLTVTSHPCEGGGWVWYLGGALAEEGVGRDRGDQVRAAREELAALFPQLDQGDLELATFRVDRAERAHGMGLKPDAPTHDRVGNVVAAWPTKLAFAPRLARELQVTLEGMGVAARAPSPPPEGPRPAVAPLPWDAAEEWIR